MYAGSVLSHLFGSNIRSSLELCDFCICPSFLEYVILSESLNSILQL